MLITSGKGTFTSFSIAGLEAESGSLGPQDMIETLRMKIVFSAYLASQPFALFVLYEFLSSGAAQQYI